ncbi:hypothetical protein ACET3Z_000185 [Daucus carota]
MLVLLFFWGDAVIKDEDLVKRIFIVDVFVGKAMLKHVISMLGFVTTQEIAAFPLLGSSVLNKSKDSPDLITPIGSTRMHMFQTYGSSLEFRIRF